MDNTKLKGRIRGKAQELRQTRAGGEIAAIETALADCDRFTSPTTERTKKYRRMFYAPDMFRGMDGHIICLPLEKGCAI